MSIFVSYIYRGVDVPRAYRLNKMKVVLLFKLTFINWDRFALIKNKHFVSTSVCI